MNEFITWTPGVTLDEIERQVIVKALNHYRNKTVTAKALGIAIRTLDNKLSIYEAAQKKFKESEEIRIAKANEYVLRARGMTPINSNPSVAYAPPPAVEHQDEYQVTKLKKK